MKKSNLFTMFARRMILITVVTGILFLGIWLLGTQLGIIRPPTALERWSTASVVVQSAPEGGDVMVDSQKQGQTPLAVQLKKGAHTIRIEKEGYLPYETRIEANPGEDQEIRVSLQFIPVIEGVSEKAGTPLWDEQGRLMYFQIEAGEIRTLDPVNSSAEAVPFDQMLTGLSVSPAGGMMGLISGPIVSEIVQINPVSGETTAVGVAGVPPVWHPGNGQYFFLGWTGADFDSPIQLWAGAAGGEAGRVTLPEIDRIELPQSMAWSSSGSYLAVQSVNHVDIWEFSGGKFAYVKRLPGNQSGWSPIGDKLAYQEGGSMDLLTAEMGQVPAVLLTGFPVEAFDWMPDGRHIILATYNPHIGGSGIWKLDSLSGALQLMVDSSAVFGKVTRLAASPEASEIALLNDLGQLFLMKTGESSPTQ